jgi:hypothetical protein
MRSLWTVDGLWKSELKISSKTKEKVELKETILSWSHLWMAPFTLVRNVFYSNISTETPKNSPHPVGLLFLVFMTSWFWDILSWQCINPGLIRLIYLDSHKLIFKIESCIFLWVIVATSCSFYLVASKNNFENSEKLDFGVAVKNCEFHRVSNQF